MMKGDERNEMTGEFKRIISHDKLKEKSKSKGKQK